jgi:alpha/beta hydrolase family protein
MIVVRWLTAGVAATVALTFALPAAAKVIRFEIVRTEPYGSFLAGDYVRMDGRAFGELSPDEKIPGIDKAARNTHGKAEYSTPITIIGPKDASRGNGALLFDVANRGSAIAQALYNSPRGKFLPLGSFEAGTGFLQDRGFTVVTAAWELGQKIEFPHFTDSSGKALYVEGVGLAAIRDVVDFLHHAAADDAGAANPLAGSINRALAFGYSQTARLLKTMLIEGFNQAEGRRVFDGVHLQASAGGLATILVTTPGPDSSSNFTPRFTAVDLRGVNEEPFTYEDIVGRIKMRGEVPPKIAVTNMTTDYFSIRASLARTGSRGTTEAPIPANVRIYDVAGASHGRSRSSPGCEMPPGQLDWSPVLRAVLVALDDWVSHNRPPPPNTLMPLEARPNDETVLPAPKHLRDAVIEVPRQDADGNFVGGVRLPDVEVPLGVHGIQNRPLSDRSCNLVAAYMAFPKTPADRKPGDTRPSIKERYKDGADYVNRIRVSTRWMIEQRFLLPEDGVVIIQAATQSPAFD